MRHLAAFALSFVLAAPFVASATPKPAPQKPAVAATCAGPRVVESSLSHAVEKRHAVGEAIAFAPGESVYALAVVENRGPGATVEMFWKRDGVVRSRVQLDVGTAKGWRTWSKHTVGKRDAGAWTVEVRSEGGTLLDTLAFEVLSPAAVAAW